MQRQRMKPKLKECLSPQFLGSGFLYAVKQPKNNFVSVIQTLQRCVSGPHS